MVAERFEPNSEHGRPKIASFTSPEGAIAVHCDRDDGALWLFAHGPSGGDRGRLVFPLSRAADLLAWTEASDGLISGGARGRMALRDGRLIVGVTGWSRTLNLPFGDAAEFLLCLREWALADEWALAAGPVDAAVTSSEQDEIIAREALWTARIADLLDRAIDELRSGEDFIATVSAANAACDIMAGALPEDELEASWWGECPECTCPPDLVARGGFTSGCLACR
jgi:hypothetical protein